MVYQTMTGVLDEIAALAELYRTKHAEYGPTEIFAGKVLAGLFPNGLRVETELEFTRMALFLHIVNKVLRYANSFNEKGHADSLRDLALYSLMLGDIDARPPDRLRDDRPVAEPNDQRHSSSANS